MTHSPPRLPLPLPRLLTTRIAIAGAAILAAAWFGHGRSTRFARAATLANAELARVELEGRSADIAFYSRRAAEDPRSAEDRAMLAALYLQRARETGSRSDYREAEGVATASLALRTARNGKARLLLASAMLAQHKFPEALTAARELVGESPDVPGYRALLAELYIEMGMYDSAAVQFDSLRPALRSLAVAPRHARYLEFRGEGEQARAVLRRTLALARRETGLPREQLAWFALRLGDAELRAGHLRAARSAIADGLTDAPGDRRLLALRARAQALAGRWRDALADIEAVGAQADIQTLALAGDAWEALGDRARARAAWQRSEQSARDNPEPFNRQWTLFRLEHGLALPETRAILEREIGVRRDVYGWAQLAWARLLTGDPHAANHAMQQALSVGTADAWLWFLAGEVASAEGRGSEARQWYRRALELNPHFHHRYAAVVRARLAGN